MLSGWERKEKNNAYAKNEICQVMGGGGGGGNAHAKNEICQVIGGGGGGS